MYMYYTTVTLSYLHLILALAHLLGMKNKDNSALYHDLAPLIHLCFY